MGSTLRMYSVKDAILLSQESVAELVMVRKLIMHSYYYSLFRGQG